jgi:4-amino-4-deoxy-L-arabinose transferase-like glycosyltransferase
MLMRAILLLLATLVALLPSWLRADWDGTEGRRVQIALEMLSGQNWMVPMLGGEPTWAKPPLHYWLLMILIECFGDNTMVLRLPAVLSVFASSFLAGEILRRRFGECAGWMVAFGIICSPIVLFVWPTAEIDPLFASLIGMSMWLLAAGVADRRAPMVLASGLLAGLAFLQKGPPFFLFGVGAYLVWWRHRRLTLGLWYFVPMALVIAAYFVPLWLWFVDPEGMLRIAGDESVGRIRIFQWQHVQEAPIYWLRALFVLLPFGFWCFWEWRGARDVRMSANDLTLRMCSGGAVLAVVLLTFFPMRPTRYLLPNVMLFTFAVSPAVAHFFRYPGTLPLFARSVIGVMGFLGAVAMIAIPFVPRAGVASVGLAFAAALLPLVVHTPRHVVLAALLLPIVGSWTVGLERSLLWSEGKRAYASMGRLLGRELRELGAADDLGSYGHIHSPMLLASGLWPEGSEMRRRFPETRWMIHEDVPARPVESDQHRIRWRMETPKRTFVVRERRQSPK